MTAHDVDPYLKHAGEIAARVDVANEQIEIAKAAIVQAWADLDLSGAPVEAVRALYWRTDVPTKVLVRAWRVPTVRAFLELVGPREVGECRCGRPIVEASRSSAVHTQCEDCREAAHAAVRVSGRVRDEQRAEEIAALRSMPYADYLRSDHWQEVRRVALRRAKYRCQACNASTSLHVHHRTYERRGAELPSDVIALCAACHQLFHERRAVTQ